MRKEGFVGNMEEVDAVIEQIVKKYDFLYYVGSYFKVLNILLIIMYVR